MESPIPEKYLPIGSVVRLVNGTKKIMIFGRLQIQASSGQKWDYVACLYPEGNLNEKYNGSTKSSVSKAKTVKV